MAWQLPCHEWSSVQLRSWPPMINWKNWRRNNWIYAMAFLHIYSPVSSPLYLPWRWWIRSTSFQHASINRAVDILFIAAWSIASDRPFEPKAGEHCRKVGWHYTYAWARIQSWPFSFWRKYAHRWWRCRCLPHDRKLFLPMWWSTVMQVEENKIRFLIWLFLNKNNRWQ